MRHALILAAGRGERMRPLTDDTPKPLLIAGGRPLIVWHLEKLAAAGVGLVVINTSQLADQFEPLLGNGDRWGLRVVYSYEGPEPLETGGGMLRALPLLGPEPFIALSADINTDYDYARLPVEPNGLVHLVMVPNPDWYPGGDFSLEGNRLHEAGPGQRLTFGNIGVYRPGLVENQPPGCFKLGPLYRKAMAAGQASGELFEGRWTNVGTPAQLTALDSYLLTGTTPTSSRR
jgi:N-acetyl-alpha-D-muramate 1-phosphate uridylyltransferase